MGELAALITAVCWAASSIFFSEAGQRVGSLVVNRMRLLFAVGWIIAAHWITTGAPLPLHASAQNWLWLGLSGIVGLAIGDMFLFQAYVMIGARLGTLLMATVPVISTGLAWLFLGETMDVWTTLGVAITVSGILLVVVDRRVQNGDHLERRNYLLGVLCGLGGALGQAGGLILAKLGLTDGFPSTSAVVIRMITAGGFMWILALFTNQVKVSFDKMADRKALKRVFWGSIVGPFIGVWLSMIAIQNTLVGIASTLMALTPIILLPVARIRYQERITLRSIIGTILAIAGSAVLFIL